jgi:hypothetical protein
MRAAVPVAVAGIVAVAGAAAAQPTDPAAAVARLCAKTVEIQGRPSCYPGGWTPALRELARRTAGADAKALERDTAVETPGELVRFPDGESRVVFRACRPHACPEAWAYFLVDPAGRRMNIVWRSEQGVKYLGPDAEPLSTRKLHEWLESRP